MKTTHPTHLPRSPRLRTSLAAAGLCLPILSAAELKFTLGPGSDNFQLGASFAALGDIDGDGIADLAVGDPSYRSGGTLLGSGIVYVISGADGSILRSHEGEPARNQSFGTALATLDADGDGIPDLAVGAPGHAGSTGFGSGAVRIYSGADGSLLSSATGPAGSQYGASLCPAGDRDGDGRDDLHVGAPNANSSRGAVFVQSGADGSTLASLGTDASLSQFGATLAPAGDLDGDGLGDVAVGAPGFRVGSVQVGRVLLIRSSDNGIAAQRAGTGNFERLGESLAPAGDVDGDGLPDVMIGSYSGGTALVASGADLSTLIDLSLPGLATFQRTNVGGGDDIDGDGVTDWLIGSPGLNPIAPMPAGGIRVVSGADGSTLLERLSDTPFTGLGERLRVLPGYGFAAGEAFLADPATGGSGFAHFWHIPRETAVPDSDGDGFPDDVDAVPDSIMDPTVRVLGINSGVENRVDVSGTTLADRYSALGTVKSYRSPGLYLAAATRLTVDLRRTGLITTPEAVRLTAAAVVGTVSATLRR